jgi:hypothetical protein
MSGAWQGGKGSRPRPYSVDQKTFDNNWDNIFNKKKQSEDVPVLENEETWSQRVIDENDKKAKE